MDEESRTEGEAAPRPEGSRVDGHGGDGGQAECGGDVASRNFHTRRLETLGLLSGGIAHDFNNMLTGILGHVTYLKTILPAQGPHTESLTAIEHGARRASGVTHQILDFARLDPSDGPAVADLGDVVVRTCLLLRGAVPPRFSFRYKVPEEPLPVSMVEGRVAQLIVNLVINARDAVGQNGLIEVGLERCADPERAARARREVERLSPGSGRDTPDAPAAEYARLFVLDDGHGMPAGVRERMFEPFFTTKDRRGNGLGLSVVREVVCDMRGGLEVSSQEGVGTNVSVFFPVDRRPADAPHGANGAREDDEAVRGSEERVLVVDDEFPVRNVVAVGLEHLGYSVEMVASGQEALEKYAGPGAFDLVILDMLMPALSGDQVFDRLRAVDPDVRVLIISGFSSEKTVARMLADGGKDFIQKPFTIQELSRKVRKCLTE